MASAIVLLVLIALSAVRSSLQACNSTTEFTCDNGRCLDQQGVCDYYDDCKDNSDERNCRYPAADSRTALVYTTDGLSLTQSGSLWKLSGAPTDYVYKLGNSSYSGLLPIHLNYVFRGGFGEIAVDYETHTLYFNNRSADMLQFGWFIYEQNPTAPLWLNVPLTPKQVKGMAFDWLSKSLYWTNGQRILVTKFTAAPCYTRTLVFPSVTSSIQDLAVDAARRHLFWYDSTTSGILIRTDLLGNNRVNLTIASPATRLALDCNAQTVYFLDTTSGRLASISYDGTSYTLLGNFSGRGSIAVDSQFIYMGDSVNSVIYVHRKQDGSLISNFASFHAGPIRDITIFSQAVQPSGNSPCLTNNGGCSQICIPTSSATRVCRCDSAYTLSADGLTCSATSGNCDSVSQFRCKSGACITLGAVCDYYDDCGDNGDENNCGFPTANNDTAVVFTTGDGTMSALWKLFGNPDDYVNKLPNDSYRYALPLHLNYIWEKKSNYFGVIAVDYETKLAYFNNLDTNELDFGPLIYENAITTLQPVTVVPRKVIGMTLDWLSKNIYWTNGNSIMVTKKDLSNGIYTKTLFSNMTSSVKDIAVDPIQRYLFWFDSASTNVLTRADLTGGNRNSLTISSPATRLALDCTAQTVYFLDTTSGRLASIRYDGTSYTLLGTFSGRGSIAVHSSYIFLGDSIESVVYIHDKATGALMSQFTSFPSGPVGDIKTFSRANQPAGTSPCTANNGGCEQICLATSSTAKSCDCKNDVKLMSDGLKCGASRGIADAKFQHWIVGLASVLLLVYKS